MAFVTCLMLVPLEMIDDLVFHHKGFQDTGLNVILALVAVNLVAFCFWTLRPRFGMRGKQWRAMQERLAVSQQETDHSAQVAAAIGAQAAGHLLSDSDSDLARGLGGVAQVAGAVGTGRFPRGVPRRLALREHSHPLGRRSRQDVMLLRHGA